MTKRKSDYPETEYGIEIGVDSSLAPTEPEAAGMEQGLFADLVKSIKEAGSILRGEREAARRTRFDETAGAEEGHGQFGGSDSGEADR